MLEAIKKNKKNIVMIILFGVVWILIIPVILGIDKISKKYPKVCKCIALTIYIFIMAFCVYVLISKHQIYYLPIFICMMLSFYNTMKKNDR